MLPPSFTIQTCHTKFLYIFHDQSFHSRYQSNEFLPYTLAFMRKYVIRITIKYRSLKSRKMGDHSTCNKPSQEGTPGSDSKSLKIGFIGGGMMAWALAEGIVSKGIVQYTQIYVSNNAIELGERWTKKGAHFSVDNGFVAENADMIFLSVKPTVLDEAISGIKNKEKVVNKVFVSILAGVPLAKLESAISGFKDCYVIRVMPNTPMMVGAGASVFTPGKGVKPEQIEQIRTILGSVGICRQIPEYLMSPVTALSGSGPAYVFTFIEALSDGAVKMGLPRDLATEFAAQTVMGSGKMVLMTGRHTGTLKDEVCSPGGTTITGIHALEKGGLRGIVMDAIEAAATKKIETSH